MNMGLQNLLKRFRRRPPVVAAPGQISAVYLTDWLHNELAETSNADTERAYYAVINHVAIMQGAKYTTCSYCATEVVFRDGETQCCGTCGLEVVRAPSDRATR